MHNEVPSPVSLCHRYIVVHSIVARTKVLPFRHIPAIITSLSYRIAWLTGITLVVSLGQNPMTRTVDRRLLLKMYDGRHPIRRLHHPYHRMDIHAVVRKGGLAGRLIRLKRMAMGGACHIERDN
jgi:hypothetical protein